MTQQQLLVLVIFAACYLGATVLRKWRALVVWAAVALLIATGAVTPLQAARSIDWNVIGMLLGMAVLARLFTTSGVPTVVARQIATRAPSARLAILSVCFAAGFLSSWVDNVATVLIVAPVAFAIADHLKADPAPFLIALTVSANLRGAATLIGDATSMILASYSGMTFNDFFWFHGRPSLFFVVQVASMAAVLVLQRVFRAHRRKKAAPFPPVTVTSWVPAILLLAVIAILAASHLRHLRIRYLAAFVCLGAAGIGLAHFYGGRIRRQGVRDARFHLWHGLLTFDWKTVLFLSGLFVVVGSVSSVGLVGLVAEGTRQVFGSNLLVAFLVVVGVSVLVSGMIDSIPYVTAMVPVVSALGKSLAQGPRDLYILLFGLLIGGTLGGNMVPIGASTSIVSVGLLEKRGRRVGPLEFMRIGVPYTVVATIAAMAFIWVFWELIP